MSLRFSEDIEASFSAITGGILTMTTEIINKSQL